MGLTSSLLDENRSNYLKEQVDTRFNEFAAIYRKQYILAYLSQVQDELEQHKQQHTQLLQQKNPLEPGTILYEENVQFFEDGKKFKHRFVVVRANYILECHKSYKAFSKGDPPLHRLMPTGGTVFTSEEKYLEMLDQCYPYTSNVKEDLVPSVASMPGNFPVYLRLPYRQDPYFCLYNEEQQTEFVSILSDCIRHQNKDFLKKDTCEVKAFLKALQFYRQEKGQYELWDMLTGSDVRVLSNLIMEDLMPYLDSELEPFLKTKKADRRKIWLATIEAAYFLVSEHLLERLNALKEECKETAKQQEPVMRSNMDQITSSRAFLEDKLKALVAEPATTYCTEHVSPYLPAVLEEVMVPISLGFTEARELSEGMMEQLCEDFQDSDHKEELHQALFKMSTANLQSCFDKVSGLADHVQELQQTFNYSIKGLQDSTELDIKQLMENVEYTYELLLKKALEDPSINFGMAIQKASSRVLKQYDYDSSTVRKKIFQDALIDITLPSIKKHLAPSFKEELPNFEQHIFADCSNFINVENVYEDILQKILEKEVRLVVNEAASKKKYNLYTESRYNFSVSSTYSTPPDSPGYSKTSPNSRTALPSPLLSNGRTESNSFNNEPEPDMRKVVQSSPKSEMTEKSTKKSETQHSTTPTQDLPAAVPITVKANAEENMLLREESVDEVFNGETVNEKTTKQTETSMNASAETRPELVTTPNPAAMVTEALQRALSSKSSEGVKASSSDFANAPTAEISPVSCSEVKPELTAPPAGEEDNNGPAAKVEGWINDHCANKKSKYPIAVCLPIENAEAGINIADDADDIIKKPSGIQNIIDPKNDCESQASSSSPVEEDRPLDCVKAIRDLVVEVFEVEEVIQPPKDNEENVEVETFEAVV
ncbi:protein Niban 1a isoform X2 [Misgurnus anguillicaudatus]|uniref:protein Niban 1a isoform X1 n=1 Tax=Misgurnus anguillicaudatus TaxID=75329 RepID=UPI003CCFC675